ncbi:MAG: hypothetical protein IPL70_13380 [Uliginosibacterium sp.]|nr:hypothetical protein [Uliginosibacterium sp.]
MILRTLAIAAAVIAALWLVALALDAVVGWLQSLEGWQRGAIVAAGLACVAAVAVELTHDPEA